jgi:hypothetical protein
MEHALDVIPAECDPMDIPGFIGLTIFMVFPGIKQHAVIHRNTVVSIMDVEDSAARVSLYPLVCGVSEGPVYGVLVEITTHADELVRQLLIQFSQIGIGNLLGICRWIQEFSPWGVPNSKLYETNLQILKHK